jgi:hypothetical protein
MTHTNASAAAVNPSRNRKLSIVFRHVLRASMRIISSGVMGSDDRRPP